MSSLQLLPQLSLPQTVGLLLAFVVGWVVLRLVFGGTERIAKRWPLFALRSLLFGVLALLLLNPVITTRTEGDVERSELFYIVDSSASMNMGSGSTRWSDSVKMIQEADEAVRKSAGADIRLFRFGRRLASVNNPKLLGLDLVSGRSMSDTQSTETQTESSSPIEPVDSDSRLLQALRRTPSRFGRKPPAGIVLFSDGRVREPENVVKLASTFKKLGVPIHVAPQGNLSGGGDIAIVGAVAPRNVRKYSDVNINIFLRSFGYDGVQSSLQLIATDMAGVERIVQTLPVTLQSGFQSKTLTYRSGTVTENLRIEVQAQPDELATNNNSFETEILVDRTKIRVLYVEGSPSSPRVVMRGDTQVVEYTHTPLTEALSSDPDIECIALQASGSEITTLTWSQSSTNGLPQTQAELMAFDCMIVSNTAAHLFDQEKLEWIHSWVSERGGGFMMVGGENSFGAGHWQDSNIAKLLPVTMSDDDDWNPVLEVKASVNSKQSQHPIWRILDDEFQRNKAIQSLPGFTGANAGLRMKSGIARSLATANGLSAPVRQASGLSGVLNSLLGAGAPSAAPNPAAANDSGQKSPILVAGQYGKGRSLAMGVGLSRTHAKFTDEWGPKSGEYFGRFWRNVVYWLTEASSIGRRRLSATTDKRYYKPGEKLKLIAHAFDEQSREASEYEIQVSMEPQEFTDDTPFEAPVRWPDRIPRDSGEEGPLVVWGETVRLPKASDATGGFGMEFQLADSLVSGTASQAVRFELTVSQDGTMIDSTSVDVQILHDPFEQQNPFPDHKLMNALSEQTGGSVLNKSADLAKLISGLPVKTGAPKITTRPAWNRMWLLVSLLILLTIEWLMRRHYGLA